MFLRNSWSSYPAISRCENLEQTCCPDSCVQHRKNDEGGSTPYSSPRNHEQCAMYQSQKFGYGYQFRSIGDPHARSWSNAMPITSTMPDMCESIFDLFNENLK